MEEVLLRMQGQGAGAGAGAAGAANGGAPATQDGADPSEIVMRLYPWGGRAHLLPENFRFKLATVKEMWVAWLCPNVDERIPALRNVPQSDVADKNTRNRLSDLRFLMRKVESAAAERGLFDAHARYTVQDADRIFAMVGDSVMPPRLSPQQRERRIAQLQWRTVVTLLRTSDAAARRAQKRPHDAARAASSAGDSGDDGDGDDGTGDSGNDEGRDEADSGGEGRPAQRQHVE